MLFTHPWHRAQSRVPHCLHGSGVRRTRDALGAVGNVCKLSILFRQQRSCVIARFQTEKPLPQLNKTLAASEWDAIIIGSGVGGLTTATQLAAQGAKVLVLERYIIPGGSAGQFERNGFRFDVGSSMMFGLSEKAGSTNLLTRALAQVGRKLESIPDPAQVIYHLPRGERFPDGLDLRVPCDWPLFLESIIRLFPHEEAGIRGFYGECWQVFNALNELEFRSLEEVKFLTTQFFKAPFACLTLARYMTTNTASVARKHITDPELLNVIDMECYCWSTVRADRTPFINTGMVLCDRFYGGVRYPKGGVGAISRELAEGLQAHGGTIVYKANVSNIIVEGSGSEQHAVGVQMMDGSVIRAKAVISNSTRWNTFGDLLPAESMPPSEAEFRKRFVKAPSFFSLHLGVRAHVLPEGTECHHILLDSWDRLEAAHGSLFVSIPSLLDPSLAPTGYHTIHAFVPEYIEEYKGLSASEYAELKQKHADRIIARLESALFPGLKDAIVFQEAGSPRTHQKFLGRQDGTYGPIPMRPPTGILSMPFNSTDIEALYCVGDSTFPGQGVNAVAFSGFGCAHRVLVDLGKESTWPVPDRIFKTALKSCRSMFG